MNFMYALEVESTLACFGRENASTTPNMSMASSILRASRFAVRPALRAPTLVQRRGLLTLKETKVFGYCLDESYSWLHDVDV